MALTKVIGSGIGQVTDIKIGGSGSANTLNDYEEGTFSVTVQDAASGGNSNAMAGAGDADGVYTKIGDIVFYSIAGAVNTSGLTGGHDIFFHGLPFTANNKTNFYEGTIPRIVGTGIDLDNNYTTVTTTVGESTSTVRVFQQGDAQTSKTVQVNLFTDDTQIRMQGMYHTDS